MLSFQYLKNVFCKISWLDMELKYTQVGCLMYRDSKKVVNITNDVPSL